MNCTSNNVELECYLEINNENFLRFPYLMVVSHDGRLVSVNTVNASSER